MKNVVALAVLMVLVAAPALAGDGNVPQATLSALGLGGMQVVSDAQGMQVRGMSSNAQATSVSFFSAFLFDPFSGSNFAFVGADFGRATDENAGLNATSSASVASAAGNAALTNSITTGTNTWTATVSVINVSGMATATSP